MSMNVLVAGATGKTGRFIVKELLDQGHLPTALIRESSDTSDLPDGTRLRRGDLTDLKSGVCNGMDAVVFAAGSGGSTSQEMTDKVDKDGAKSLIDHASAQGVDRFVMLSSVGADQANPDGNLAHYLSAKHEADQHLKQSGLTYAILRPVALTDDIGGNGITLGDDVDKTATAARPDVARALAIAAVSGNLDGQALDMQSN